MMAHSSRRAPNALTRWIVPPQQQPRIDSQSSERNGIWRRDPAVRATRGRFVGSGGRSRSNHTVSCCRCVKPTHKIKRIEPTRGFSILVTRILRATHRTRIMDFAVRSRLPGAIRTASLRMPVGCTRKDRPAEGCQLDMAVIASDKSQGDGADCKTRAAVAFTTFTEHNHGGGAHGKRPNQRR